MTTMNKTTGVEAEVRVKKPWRKQRPQKAGPPPGGGAVYGLGMIGALVYFFGSATSGGDYILAFPKAMFWPAILVYRALKTLDG
jgi:hypothetical protein